MHQRSQRGCDTGIPVAYGRFLQEAIRSISSTAALFPSSRFLTSALLKPVDFRNGRVVVELGSGTGAVTREILKRLPVEGRLYAFDVNFNFIRHLRSTCRDPRLIVVHTNAENLLTTLSGLGVNGVSAVISSLGLTGMSPDQRNQILHQAATCLEAGGVMTQFQYVGGFAKCPSNSKFRIRRFRERQFLRHFFRSVSVEPVLFNLPPAMVFTCRK